MYVLQKPHNFLRWQSQNYYEGNCRTDGPTSMLGGNCNNSLFLNGVCVSPDVGPTRFLVVGWGNKIFSTERTALPVSWSVQLSPAPPVIFKKQFHRIAFMLLKHLPVLTFGGRG